MTWSAPSEVTRSVFAVLQTPVTSAPKAFGELDGVAADATGGTDHQDRLAGLDATDVDERPQRGGGRDGDDGGLGEGEVGGLAGELGLSGDRVLGERTRVRRRRPRRRSRTG